MNNNFFATLQRFKQNPMAMLAQKYNIPQGISRPEDIVQHLLDTGQVTQEQVNNAMRQRNTMR